MKYCDWVERGILERLSHSKARMRRGSPLHETHSCWKHITSRLSFNTHKWQNLHHLCYQADVTYITCGTWLNGCFFFFVPFVLFVPFRFLPLFPWGSLGCYRFYPPFIAGVTGAKSSWLYGRRPNCDYSDTGYVECFGFIPLNTLFTLSFWVPPFLELGLFY